MRSIGQPERPSIGHAFILEGLGSRGDRVDGQALQPGAYWQGDRCHPSLHETRTRVSGHEGDPLRVRLWCKSSTLRASWDGSLFVRMHGTDTLAIAQAQFVLI